MNKQNKSYCRVPFDSVTVSPTGRMQLCCEALWTGGSEKTKIKDINKNKKCIKLFSKNSKNFRKKSHRKRFFI